MPKRGKKMPFEERLACVKQIAEGKTFQQIAQETGWSRWTIRKMHRAHQKDGEAGLAVKMGRPARGALSSYPMQVCVEIKQMRDDHPGWGPLTLLAELRRHPAYIATSLPSRARVAAFLKAKKLTRRYERHVALPQPPAEPALQPHDLWEMDAQGAQIVDGLGPVSILNILDVVSRMKAESYPHVASTKLAGPTYQLILRCAFVRFGLPKAISLDHDSAFFDNTSGSPYPTRLHLWLLAMGVLVIFITQPPPKEHAKIERGHQTMTAQTIEGQSWHSQGALWRGLSQRREFLNCFYPSQALHGQAPIDAFPQAIHSGRDYRPEWEKELLDLQPVYAFLSQGHWFRETNLHGEFWLGMQRYNAGRTSAHTTQEITFDPSSVEFVAKTIATGQIRRFPAKGLTKIDLMGELAPVAQMPNYQFVLPFSLDAWRQNELARLLRGTTF